MPVKPTESAVRLWTTQQMHSAWDSALRAVAPDGSHHVHETTIRAVFVVVWQEEFGYPANLSEECMQSTAWDRLRTHLHVFLERDRLPEGHYAFFNPDTPLEEEGVLISHAVRIARPQNRPCTMENVDAWRAEQTKLAYDACLRSVTSLGVATMTEKKIRLGFLATWELEFGHPKNRDEELLMSGAWEFLRRAVATFTADGPLKPGYYRFYRPQTKEEEEGVYFGVPVPREKDMKKRLSDIVTGIMYPDTDTPRQFTPPACKRTIKL